MLEVIIDLAAIFAAFGLGRLSKDFNKVKWADLNGNIYYFDVDFDPNQVRTGWYRSID